MVATLSELARDLASPEDALPKTLSAHRHTGAHFLQGGLDWPAAKAEAWRHTGLQELAAHPWKQTPATPAQPQLLARVEALLAHSIGLGPRLVFVDGIAAPSLWRLPQQPGVRIDGLANLQSGDEALRSHLGALGLHTDEAFAALNTAMLSQGAFVAIAPQTCVAEPITVAFVHTAQAGDALLQPRVLAVAGERSEGTIVEQHLSLESAVSWCNAVSEVVVDAGARLNYVLQQSAASNSYHLGTVGVRIGRDAHCALTTFDEGAKLCRRGIRIELLAQGADVQLAHVALSRGEQHQATQVTVRHISGHTTSRQVFKSVADERSTASFAGTMHILENAPQAHAQQLSRGLLLSPLAKVFLRPQLMIFTDDVRCAHGATIGSLDEQALFYLQSRGLSKAQAQQMLTFAFLGEAIDGAPASVRPRLVERIAAWLGSTADMGLSPADWRIET